ncbi:MAG TPA: FecR domain-containing protein [Gemmatimonadaceae bacterium]
MTDGYPWELLVRYGAGDATPDEMARLASWRGDDAERSRVLRRVGRLGELSRVADAARHTDAAWERLHHRMERVAMTAEGGARVLSVRRRRFEATMPTTRTPAWRGRLAAGIAAAALAAISLALWTLRPARPATMREVASRRGERIELGLPDGSHVVLGADSRLRFAATGFARSRTLYLDGQGYFAVAHDTRHPFIVHARGAAVQAVGTAFGVRAYGDDSTVSVAVAHGRVLLRGDAGASGSGTVLDRGDLGQMDLAGRATVRRGANLDPYLGWVHGRLIYDMAPVEDVVRDLERWYDLSIHIDAAAKRADLRVNMTIDPTQPAPVSLQRLAEVLNLRVVQTGETVELAGHPASASP